MADFQFYNNLEDLDDGGEEGERGYGIMGRDCVLIAVDCCEEMFVKNESDEALPFSKVCEATKDLLRNRIICSERDYQGIIFFGTGNSKNPNDFNHIFLENDLDSPSASRIEELQTLQESSQEVIREKYGQSEKCQISELLWCCSSVFSRSTAKMAAKTVVIFTWNDDPHQGDRNAQLRARTKAKDLMEQDIVIQVLTFNPQFSYDKFYKDIVSESDMDVTLVQNPIAGITSLYDFLLRKVTKQRTLASISFQLFDGMELGINVYTPVRRAAKGKNVNIDSRTNKEVQLKRNFVEKATGEILLTSDIKYSQKWGGRDIAFDYDEVQNMKKFSGAGMKLLGFKPRDKAIKAHQHVRTSQFIYPNEKSVKGSTSLFSALLIKCIARNVVPICSLSPRSNSPPKLVALLPQPEVIDDETKEQTQSPGFYVIYLPFSEDIRNVEPPETKEPNEDAVGTAEKIIRKLKFTYNPSNFDNPALQTHYRNLEAMALEKDAPEKVDDFTLPNCERINQKAGDLVSTFREQVFPEGYDPTKKSGKAKQTAAKRKAADANGGPSAKQVNIDDVKEMAVTGKLGKLTVPVLKNICKTNAIEAGGKKKDLVEAIEKFFM